MNLNYFIELHKENKTDFGLWVYFFKFSFTKTLITEFRH